MKLLGKILVTLCLTLLFVPIVAQAQPTNFVNDTENYVEPSKVSGTSADKTGETLPDPEAFTPGYQTGELPDTLIPHTKLDQTSCFNLLYKLNLHGEFDLENLAKMSEKDVAQKYGIDGGLTLKDILGCAIKTGMFKLWMLPLLIKFIIDFLLSAAGLIAVLFIVVGGYIYMFGGLADDKERGKKAILYGVIGFVVALLAWVVVNAIQILVTS